VKRGQALILVLAVAAIGLMAVVAGGGKKKDSGTSTASRTGTTAARAGGGGASTTAPAPAGALAISFDYSPEKKPLLAPLINAFNRSGTQVDGRTVFVRGTSVSSGDTENAIAKGTKQPIAWSPAGSLWGRLLNFEADKPYVAEKNPSLVRSPLVIAMWEPMARALGWPKKRLGFADILRLARSNTGWGAYGHPEFGRFKLVHTNPDFSTSGLSAVVAEYYSATGKKEGLLAADVERARPQVRAIERSIVHYGDTTPFISGQLRKAGPGYASAVAMEETTLVEFNADRGSQPRLVAIYPREGTFYSDDPFIVLNAPWVSASQKRGALAFRDYLVKRLTPQAVARGGFRPADLRAKPLPPLDAAHGVDPSQPERVLALPESRVLAQIKRTWREDRKPANVLLVLDTSGSMNEQGRLRNAKAGLTAFVREVAPQDRVGLLAFSDEIMPLVPIAPMRTNRARLLEVVRGVPASGETKVYDATVSAVTRVADLADSSRINAVVLLSDGTDNSSVRTASDVLRELRAQGESERKVRVFTIAYDTGGTDAALRLQEIADASGGKAYSGTTSDIQSVYRQISSFF
jgi:Ca-activated chloride channel family protein